MGRARGVELDVGWGLGRSRRAGVDKREPHRALAGASTETTACSVHATINRQPFRNRCAKGGHRKSGGGSKTPPSDTCPALAWKKSGESCGGPCSAAAVRRRPAMPGQDHHPHYTQDMVWQEYDVKRPPKLGGVFEN